MMDIIKLKKIFINPKITMFKTELKGIIKMSVSIKINCIPIIR